MITAGIVNSIMHEIHDTLRDAFEERMESIQPPSLSIYSDVADSASDAETTPIAPFQTFKDELKCNCEYLIAGLLLGLHFPTVAWLLLVLVSASPSVIVFRHSEWFQSTNPDLWLDLMKILGLCLASDLYALYCIGRLLQVN